VSLRELSPFHDAYGYYARGVGERTAVLPEGWQARLVPVPTPAGTGLCLETQIQDLTPGRRRRSKRPSVST
jgi:hypothetical protein